MTVIILTDLRITSNLKQNENHSYSTIRGRVLLWEEKKHLAKKLMEPLIFVHWEIGLTDKIPVTHQIVNTRFFPNKDYGFLSRLHSLDEFC